MWLKVRHYSPDDFSSTSIIVHYVASSVGLNKFYSGIKYTEKDWVRHNGATLPSPKGKRRRTETQKHKYEQRTKESLHTVDTTIVIYI